MAAQKSFQLLLRRLIEKIRLSDEISAQPGVPKGKVRLSIYQTQWVNKFSNEQNYLSNYLGLPSERIIHFGSTSIPGCDAKDIIDIAIPFRTLRDSVNIQHLLSHSDYGSAPVYYLHDRICYTKGVPQEYHLYIVDESSPTFLNWKLFRDMLLKDEALKLSYIELKRTLASQYENDRTIYTEKKSDFIYEVLNQNDTWTRQISQMMN